MSHYVITVDIKHVTEKPVPGKPDTRYSGAPAATERVVEDVTHVVTKSEELPKAVAKAVDILQLELPPVSKEMFGKIVTKELGR